MSAAADGHGLGEAGARGPGLVRRLWDRLYRSARIGFTALGVWLRYKGPTWYDRVQGTDPEARDKSSIHRRNATQIFNTAVSMRGMLIKMCQVVGTRSDVFPPEYVRTLSECHDRLRGARRRLGSRSTPCSQVSVGNPSPPRPSRRSTKRGC